jgi:hypothetical protein
MRVRNAAGTRQSSLSTAVLLCDRHVEIEMNLMRLQMLRWIHTRSISIVSTYGFVGIIYCLLGINGFTAQYWAVMTLTSKVPLGCSCC